MRELRAEEEKLYKNFTRLRPAGHDFILERITPLIRREDTNMRKSNTSSERLAVTLRHLATGCSYRQLAFCFRIPIASLSEIIPETCNALYNVLEEFIKVSNFFFYSLFDH